MTATDELRRLLDERGVKWKAWDGTHPITVWHDETYLYEFIEYRLVNGAKQVNGCLSDNDGHCELTIKVFNCTPEQAIAATLGAGTCHLKPWEMERDTGFYDSMECDCGYVADVADWASWHFCPSCGRQNVEVTS